LKMLSTCQLQKPIVVFEVSTPEQTQIRPPFEKSKSYLPISAPICKSPNTQNPPHNPTPFPSNKTTKPSVRV
jgi:hypothetical protein